MTQPPYGQGPDSYQNPQQAVGGGTPPPGAMPPIGYGPPIPGGYGSQPGGVPPYGAAQPGYPGAPGPYGGPPSKPKSKTGLIIAAIVGVLAVAGVILAVVLVNRVPAPEAVVRGDDPALNQLAQSCFDGDMADCDSLFFQSPVGSDYEAYGNTCGGRIDEADVEGRRCTSIF